MGEIRPLRFHSEKDHLTETSDLCPSQFGVQPWYKHVYVQNLFVFRFEFILALWFCECKHFTLHEQSYAEGKWSIRQNHHHILSGWERGRNR